MILKDVLAECNKKLIVEYLKKLHSPDWNNSLKNAYLQVFNTVSEKGDETKPDFVIVLKYFEDEKYWNVFGIEPAQRCRYGIEYVPWAEWANAHVFLQPNSPSISLEEIAANILWEMTCNGFTEKDIEEKKNKLIKAYEDAVTGDLKIHNLIEE